MSVSPTATANNCGIEPPSDHRGRLQERAVLWREAVHARGQKALHGCGQGLRHRAGVEVQFARGGAQYAALGEEAHDLLGEQRIALGFLRHLPCQCLGQSLDAEPRLHQVTNVACGQRFQM